MDLSRRRFLSVCGASGIVGAAGCLRFTERSDDSSRPENSETNSSPESETTVDQSIRLERTWTSADLSGEATISNVAAWPYQESVLVGRYERERPDYLRLVSNDGTELWRGAEIPESHTVYRSSTAMDENHIIGGFPREGDGTLQPDNATDVGALVHCYDSTSGDLLWETTTDAETSFLSSIGLTEGGIVTVATDARRSAGVDMYGLDVASGEQLWQRSELPVDDTVTRITDSITHDSQFLVSSYWGIFALDSASGEVVNQYRQSKSPYFGLSLEDGYIYGTDSSTAVKFDFHAFSGEWETEIIGNGIGGRSCKLGDDSVFVDDGDGYVYSFDKQTGEQNWQQRVEGGTTDLALTSQHLWVSDTTGMLRGYSRTSGEMASEPMTVTTETSAAGEKVPLVGWDGAVFVGGTESGRFEIISE